MAGIIQKIITLYEMEASEISGLVTNSQKVFENSALGDQKPADGWTAETLMQDAHALTRYTDGAENDTFEKRVDKEIRRMEAFIKGQLRAGSLK